MIIKILCSVLLADRSSEMYSGWINRPEAGDNVKLFLSAFAYGEFFYMAVQTNLQYRKEQLRGTGQSYISVKIKNFTCMGLKRSVRSALNLKF